MIKVIWIWVWYLYWCGTKGKAPRSGAEPRANAR